MVALIIAGTIVWVSSTHQKYIDDLLSKPKQAVLGIDLENAYGRVYRTAEGAEFLFRVYSASHAGPCTSERTRLTFARIPTMKGEGSKAKQR